MKDLLLKNNISDEIINAVADGNKSGYINNLILEDIREYMSFENKNSVFIAKYKGKVLEVRPIAEAQDLINKWRV